MINDRNAARRFFYQAWQRKQSGITLEPLEALVTSVIDMHPEYQPLIAQIGETDDPGEVNLSGDVNPFLHLGLHVALLEQVQADRPSGIRALYQTLKTRLDNNVHDAEHRLMGVLAEVLSNAQQRGTLPDEQEYLTRAQMLIR